MTYQPGPKLQTEVGEASGVTAFPVNVSQDYGPRIGLGWW